MFLPIGLSATLYRADDLLRRRGVWGVYRMLQDSQWWPEDRLAELRKTKLRALVAHAAAHSPYYREVFAAAGLKAADIRDVGDLQALPVLTREIVRERGADIRTTGIPERDMFPNSTGGSTGSNVRFWVDRACWRWRDAADLRMWSILGATPGTPALYVWGSPMDQRAARRLRSQIRMFIDNKRFVSAYKVGPEDLSNLIDHVRRWRPKLILGYASVLDALASHVRRSGTAWPDIPELTVVSSAEVLYDEQRENIASALHARVLNLYGCREFGLVALECQAAGSLHVSEERVHVELVENGGGPNRLLVTDLDNKAFPFLRYDIGDLAGAQSGRCACRRTLRCIDGITGRTFDVIAGPSGRAVGGTFWSLLLRTAVKGIDLWQVVQIRPDLVEIRVSPRGGLSNEARQKIRFVVKEALGNEIDVQITECDRMEPLPSGKHRFVVSHSTQGRGSQIRRSNS